MAEKKPTKRAKIAEEKPHERRFIVMQMPKTDYKERFVDNEPLDGRFLTIGEARERIREECRDLVSNETELRVGRMDNYFMRYAIYEMVEELAFDAVVSCKIVERPPDQDKERK